jgi:uncharacterized protein YkwD
MAGMALLTFVGANLHTVLWQSSEWLVSTVLPAVVIDLTNEERAEQAAPPLQRNATLDEAARLKAEHMAKHEYFSHHSPDGVTPWHWFKEAGYTYAHAGENLAIHFTDSTEVVDAWMDSPTHRENIVDPKYTEIGVGTARGEYEGYDTVYVVQLFGAPGYVPEPSPAEPTPSSVGAALEAPSPDTAPETEVEAVPDLARETPAPQEPESGAPLETTESQAVEAETNDRASSPLTATSPVESNTVAPEAAGPPSEPVETTELPASDPESPVKAPVTPPRDVVVLETSLIATSSGLAVAQVTTPNQDHAGRTLASIATQPNRLLEIVYLTLGTIAVFLLSISVVTEARRLRFTQAAYGVLLLVAMGSLWFVHSWLTAGAVIL